MEIIRREDSGAAQKAAEILQSGGLVLYPTDTLYGLGADAFSDEAVEKIYALKGRDENKPIHAIVSGLDMAAEYGVLTDNVRLLSARLPKGKITFIVKKKGTSTTGIARGIGTFGFRIPDNDFCLSMLQAFGRPVTATSANKSGQIPQQTAEEVLRQLGNDAAKLELVIDGGDLPPSAPSTVVDVSSSQVSVLRVGVISQEDVFAALTKA